MTGPTPRAPATARALSAALNALGIHPAGARPADVLPLLGMLLAKIETDTAARAPVSQNPPARLTRLLAGYHQQAPTPHLGLLVDRLTRTALETGLEEPPGPLTEAAAHASMAAADLLTAHDHLAHGHRRKAINALHQAQHHLDHTRLTEGPGPGRTSLSS
ncbi:hypothetical protein [Streptomyces sp. NPDC058701]|uniref:hypothetical protein n=1 Tax=Streptomyces sp. NPDC058701 TaxID=3346608 RepID=UPI00366696DC